MRSTRQLAIKLRLSPLTRVIDDHIIGSEFLPTQRPFNLTHFGRAATPETKIRFPALLVFNHRLSRRLLSPARYSKATYFIYSEVISQCRIDTFGEQENSHFLLVQ